VLLPISIEDREPVALEVKHHLVEARVGEVSLSLGKIYQGLVVHHNGKITAVE
jgi:hypothetical protein